jgi:NAD-dependent SIR2 family protein deacetylase
VTDLGAPLPLSKSCLHAGKVIPFLGAGASFGPGGLPTARDLASALATKTRFPPEEPVALSTVAQWFEVVGGRQSLEDELHEVFAAAYAPARLHRYLAAVQAPLLVVTTNFDDMIEQAFDAAGVRYDRVVHTIGRRFGEHVLHWPHGASEPERKHPKNLDLDLSTTTVIYKMHGAVDRVLATRDQYVITEDDYIDFLARLTRRRAVPAIFAEAFQNRHFLFLGYGLRDWNLRVVLNGIERDVSGVHRIKSWAIDHEPSPLEQRFWQGRGVEVYRMSLDEFLNGLEEG